MTASTLIDLQDVPTDEMITAAAASRALIYTATMSANDWERRIDRLERTVEALERELRTRQGFALTMRATGQCRACGSRRIWRARELHLPASLGVLGMQYSFWGAPSARFEADVCASCGVVELTVVDLASLEEKDPLELHVSPEPLPLPGGDPFRSSEG
jgi:hypothetical protein